MFPTQVGLLQDQAAKIREGLLVVSPRPSAIRGDSHKLVLTSHSYYLANPSGLAVYFPYTQLLLNAYSAAEQKVWLLEGGPEGGPAVREQIRDAWRDGKVLSFGVEVFIQQMNWLKLAISVAELNFNL